MSGLARVVLDALREDPDVLRELRELLVPGGPHVENGRPAAYTVEALAFELGVSPCTVRDWISSDRLPAVKRGKRWLVSRDAVAAFVMPASPPRPPRSRPRRANGSPLRDALRSMEGER